MRRARDKFDNSLIHDDCLKALPLIEPESIDLVYLDPPFFTQKKQTLKSRDNAKEYSFDDTWENINDYINYMKQRLVECRNILKNTGSIFLHCDRSASHYLKIALDEIFGFDNFQSEIVWAYKRWSNAKTGLLNCHQIIYFYSKTKNFKFNKIFEDYSPTTNIDQIFQKRMRDINGKTKYKKNDNNDVELVNEKHGVPLSDVWNIPYLNPKASERVGYPTQKPVLLLERIISLSTDTNDTVLDPFCGSGTTLVAAKLLNRKYIGVDISEEAIELSKNRLANPIKTESNLLKLGEKAYLNQDTETVGILKSIGAVPVQRNKGIDGFLSLDGTMKPIPIKVQEKDEPLEEAINSLIKASKKNGFSTKILIACNTGKTIINDYEKLDKLDILIIKNIEKFSRLKESVLSKDGIASLPISSLQLETQLTLY